MRTTKEHAVGPNASERYRLILPGIFLLATAVQALRGALVFASPLALRATPLHLLSALVGRYATAAVLIASAALALTGMLYRRRRSWLLFTPQMTLLALSAVSSLDAVIVQHYADGVPRAWEFILSDQALQILLVLAYVYALIATILEREDLLVVQRDAYTVVLRELQRVERERGHYFHHRLHTPVASIDGIVSWMERPGVLDALTPEQRRTLIAAVREQIQAFYAVQADFAQEADRA